MNQDGATSRSRGESGHHGLAISAGRMLIDAVNEGCQGWSVYARLDAYDKDFELNDKPSRLPEAPNVLRGMRLTHLSKNDQAIKELTAKGMAPAV